MLDDLFVRLNNNCFVCRLENYNIFLSTGWCLSEPPRGTELSKYKKFKIFITNKRGLPCSAEHLLKKGIKLSRGSFQDLFPVERVKEIINLLELGNF